MGNGLAIFSLGIIRTGLVKIILRWVDSIMNYKLIKLPVHGDQRGKLVAIENLKEIPFEIKRIYYMFDTLPDESRGFHAHKDLQQLVIAMDGACKFILDD